MVEWISFLVHILDWSIAKPDIWITCHWGLDRINRRINSWRKLLRIVLHFFIYSRCFISFSIRQYKYCWLISLRFANFAQSFFKGLSNLLKFILGSCRPYQWSLYNFNYWWKFLNLRLCDIRNFRWLKIKNWCQKIDLIK